jgi:hypothetical protein
MGFFDRLGMKKSEPRPPAGPDPQLVVAGEPQKPAPTTAGGVLPRLAAARACLEARDLPGALVIYEEVLTDASARADVLVSLSGELGAHGYARELIELVAPRYDAQKHGPAAGLNLLQAYLATRDLESAQHLLDLLFALKRPDLEERLLGFSNVIADLMAAGDRPTEGSDERKKVSMITISKPMWFYGLESAAPQLLPQKEGRQRRVAFAQCAVPGLENLAERAAQPEDPLGRLSRGIPLWLAETFSFSAGYETFAAVGVTGEKHYVLFPLEWLAENVRQLHETTTGGLDYAVTGALRNVHGDFALHLRIWEVKKFRELKSLHARWTPATADEALRQLQEQLRTYMEWTALPAGNGLDYVPPTAPLAYAHALGSALTLFLGEKDLLAPAQVATSAADFLPAAQHPRGQLALVMALQRLRARGAAVDEAALAQTRAWLATDEARALGLAGVSL